MPANALATVWSSTFVPSKSPIPEFGQEGYSVAWVDTGDVRRQILVVGGPPAPGARGQIGELTMGEETIEVFIEEPA